MRYALIADAHGNYPALMAALEDARALNADKFVFLGDYYLGPYPGETVDEIARARGVAIRGNQEGYLTKLRARPQSEWTDGQFRALYWCYRALSPEQHAYLDALPETAVIEDEYARIHIAHSSVPFLGDTECALFSPERAMIKYARVDGARARMREDIENAITGDAGCLARVRALGAGVYAFGHTHHQWHFEFEGRLFVNPGSCGLPTDCEGGAPYAILDITARGIQVIERRAAYDTRALARDLRASALYAAAPVWSENTVDELITHQTQISLVFERAEEYAREIGDGARPYTVETWTRAFERWHACKREI